MKIIDRLLPIQCYSSARTNYEPRLIKPLGIVLHYFSCIYVKPDNPYDTDLCWNLFHDLNFNIKDRQYNIYHGKRAGASTHYMIGRDGEILRLVPDEYQAWHAGPSSFNGMANCNEFMFGIELIGSHNKPFEYAQYESLAWLCYQLMDKYNIDPDWITRHSDIAPGRKKDPGPSFDMDKMLQLIQEVEVYED